MRSTPGRSFRKATARQPPKSIATKRLALPQSLAYGIFHHASRPRRCAVDVAPLRLPIAARVEQMHAGDDRCRDDAVRGASRALAAHRLDETELGSYDGAEAVDGGRTAQRVRSGRKHASLSGICIRVAGPASQEADERDKGDEGGCRYVAHCRGDEREIWGWQ